MVIEKIEEDCKAWWDDENKIGRIYIIGEANKGMITKLIKEGVSVKDIYGREIGWLIDLTRLTKPLVSMSVRKVMADGISLVSGGKLAIIGMSTLIKVVLGFVVKTVRIKDIKMKFFSTEKEAIKWLKE